MDYSQLMPEDMPVAIDDIPEEWRIAAACPKYKVSNKGRIIGPQGKYLKPTKMKIGYDSVALSLGDGQTIRKYVHALVAESFIGDMPKGFIVNHIDGNKRNNNRANLEIISRKENADHWVRLGGRTRSPNAGEKGICGKCGMPLYNFECGATRCKKCHKEKNERKSLGVMLLPPTDTEWKQTPVEGYLVSKSGKVWSIKSEKVLTPGVNKPGYEYVNIGSKNHAVHRLVVEACDRIIDAAEVVDHVDHNKHNNCFENLQILSRSENTRAFQEARRAKGGTVNSKQVLTEQQAKEIIRIRHEEGLGPAMIAEKLNLNRSTVGNVIYGSNFAYLERPWATEHESQ